MGPNDFTTGTSVAQNSAGLDRAEFPATTDDGAIYDQAQSGDYQYSHAYHFDASDTFNGTPNVQV